MVHSQYYTLYGFGQIYNDMHASLWYHQTIFTALKILCTPPIHPSLHLQPLGTTGLFTIPIILLFSGITQYYPFQVVVFSHLVICI